MQQKRSLIFQGFSRKVDNFYRFSVQLNAEFRDKGSRTKRRKATGNGETLHQDDRHLCCPQLRTAR